MKRKLICAVIVLVTVIYSAAAVENFKKQPGYERFNTQFEKLQSGETFDTDWRYQDRNKVYAVTAQGNRRLIYEGSYSVSYRRFSQDKTKMWFLTGDAGNQYYPTHLFKVDGIAGTVTYLCEIQESYMVSGDDASIIAQNHTKIDLSKYYNQHCPYYFDLGNAETGEKYGEFAWEIINRGDELEIFSSPGSSVFRIHYTPAGLDYGEAEFDTATMELRVIRDDTNLDYNELPAEYKKNEHA